MTELNQTHNPLLASWVESAAGSDFPIQNLPFAIFKRRGSPEAYRGGVAIGNQIIDLAAVHAAGIFSGAAARSAAAAASETTLNHLMSLGQEAWSALRLALSRGLSVGATEETVLRATLVPQAEAEYALPAHIGDYTDFYTSIYHATTVGKQFRPDNPLLPNYRWVPIGYHGRASSIRVSGQGFHRPVGQTFPKGVEAPVFGPSKRLDYELELGVFVGQGNELGSRIDIAEAEQHVFGICLLNDWSARDIQGWEYQPLGPFLAKNFATTISPWIVTLEALAPFRLPFVREEGEPQPLAYLDSATNRDAGSFDIQLEVLLDTLNMRAKHYPSQRLSTSNYRHAYWTVAQIVTHHTVNGCNLQPGDLLGTGTLSGPEASEAGSLLELTDAGRTLINLPGDETRAFIQDGDRIIFRGHCAKEGAIRIGFGEVIGEVLPAL